MKNVGIPTMYKGIQMRSRLEARWAGFFDWCGWKWQYEPLDLNGWIPDFLIQGRKKSVLVEVKPTTRLPEDVTEKCARAAVGTGWDDAWLLVLGLSPFTPPEHHVGFLGDYRMLGWLGERAYGQVWWDQAPLGDWNGTGFCQAGLDYTDVISGEHTGNWGHDNGRFVDLAWKCAGNHVQWKAPK